MRLLLATVVAALGVGDATAADTWEEYQSKEGSFSVRLPAAPVSSVESLDTALGKVELHFVSAAAHGGHVWYLVGYCDYPAGALADAAAKDVLDGARSGALRIVGGEQLGEEKAIEVDGNPGCEFRFKATKGGQGVHGTARFLLVEDRLFQLFLVHTEHARLEQDAADKFFSSFARTKPEPISQ